jgi:hypothetical protein
MLSPPISPSPLSSLLAFRKKHDLNSIYLLFNLPPSHLGVIAGTPCPLGERNMGEMEVEIVKAAKRLRKAVRIKEKTVCMQ